MIHQPIIYHGVWQVPDARGMYTRKFTGTLSYFGDKPSTLELIHEPYSGFVSANGYYEVIWGQDAGGNIFTLFGASLLKDMSFSKITYIVRYILLGKQIKSLEEASFDTCWVKYTYLNRWAIDNRFDVTTNGNRTVVSLDFGSRPAFLSVEIDKALRLMLWGNLTGNINPYEVKSAQATNLNIDTPHNVSLSIFLKTIREFSQFLSIALFAEQHPSEVIFANKGIQVQYRFLYDLHPSFEPKDHPLIKFNELKGEMPDILKRWHSNYGQVTPICNYLLQSIRNRDSFDAPDFLIVAQAIDGYFKRFVNNTNGKDIKQYKHQIEKLLYAFKDVDVIKECNLDADILTQTRHKYSHLIPDNDKKITKSVEGEDLYWLTQKCIVLLTCCILDMLGLTIDEINLCCNQSPIDQIVGSIPPWC